MKYTYGDEVVLKKIDESNNVISKTPVVVVGITPVENEDQSKHFNAPIGTTFYAVEFGDGTDKFVSEDKLESVS